MYNVEAINKLKGEERQKVEEEIAALQELNDKINETEDAVDGGKVQKIFYGLEKGTKKLSDVFEENVKKGKNFSQTMLELFEDTPLDKFKYLASFVGTGMDKSNLLNRQYKGLVNDTNKAS
jgi:hypothetical protein